MPFKMRKYKNDMKEKKELYPQLKKIESENKRDKNTYS
jgi:hypothetical protein